jgi:hypothetical protein
MSKETFITDLLDLKFRKTGDNQYERRNRGVAHDDDCSDDERNDSFYEKAQDKFNDWAAPIIRCVKDLTRAHKVVVGIDTSSEYGFIIVTISSKEFS